MTIVELPNENEIGKHGTWVRLHVDGREYTSVRGFPEVELSGAKDRWMVTVRHNNSIIAFVYADAIRRR